ncbi:MAG: exodeoxyribonuclease VII small subunit [Lachnospiraceae bacterium]|nr:exodeoxyribonuclease VII small subunit [Lachnospiraceae bacterium]MBQ9562311.1 exodeoxyribonuclease VII small subunit [Lachnospiraceae bacterium]MBQ9594026.1 exodeoxyribonuclease VII small subunit [Lachnospiraceae bacterium]MBR0153790.1 exodeoxyribonuclease VII small subunit [Lachnospiraceae bacterium]
MEKEMTLDEKFQELEKVLEALEEPDVSLEESFRLYRQGMNLVKEANEKIDRIEKQMQVLSEEE